MCYYDLPKGPPIRERKYDQWSDFINDEFKDSKLATSETPRGKGCTKMFIGEIGAIWHDYRVATLPHYIRDEVFIEKVSGDPKKKAPKVFTKTYTNQVRALYIGLEAHGLADKPHDNQKQAIFDTGAMSICVKDGLPKLYKWQKIGSTSIGGATGTAEADVYSGGFSLHFDGQDQLQFYNVPLIEAPLPGDVDFLIGQPIIKRFKFTVDNFKSLEISV